MDFTWFKKQNKDPGSVQNLKKHDGVRTKSFEMSHSS